MSKYALSQPEPRASHKNGVSSILKNVLRRVKKTRSLSKAHRRHVLDSNCVACVGHRIVLLGRASTVSLSKTRHANACHLLLSFAEAMRVSPSCRPSPGYRKATPGGGTGVAETCRTERRWSLYVSPGRNVHCVDGAAVVSLTCLRADADLITSRTDSKR